MIDFKTMKKVGDDGKVATMQHEKGHQVKIVKSALSAMHRKQLEKLPFHKADGGPTPEQLNSLKQAEQYGEKIESNAQHGTVTKEGNVDTTLQVEGSENSPPPGFQKANSYDEGGGVDPDPYAQDEAAAGAIDAPAAPAPITSLAGPGAVTLHDVGKFLLEKLTQPIGAPNKFTTEDLKKAGSTDAAELAARNKTAAEAQPDLPALPQTTPQQQQAQADAQNPVPAQTGNPLDAFKAVPGYSEQAAGTAGTSKALQAQGNTEANLYKEAAAEEQNKSAALQNDLAEKAQTIAQVTQDIRNGHIDPGHYLASGGAPRRIATAIGLILGGISSGQTGQPNPALTFLNKQIENDLDAQKANIGIKQNLLGALEKQYNDKVVSENMFRAIRANVLADQIRQATAVSGSAQAKAAGQTAIGMLKQQYLPFVQKAAILQQLSGKPGPGGQPAPQMDPARKLLLMQKAGLIDDKQYEKGNAELDKAQGIEKLRSALKDSYDDLNSRFLAGTFSPKDRQSAINTFTGPLAKLLENRFNYTESQQQIEAIMPQRFESTQTRENKLQRIDELMNLEKSTPTLDGIGIQVNQLPSRHAVKGSDGKMYYRSADGRSMLPVQK
jgi:hypothetical protein